MRIGLAVDTYYPYVSGVTIHVGLLKQTLEKFGHEVCVFSFGSSEDRPAEKGVILSPGYRLPIGYRFGLRYSPEALRIMGELDLIHIHHPFLSGMLVLRAVREKVPLVFTAHTRYDHSIHDYLPGGLRQVVFAWVRNYLPRFCGKMSRVICNSAASVEGLRRCGVQCDVAMIPNGVDLHKFQSRAVDRSWRERMGGFGFQLLYTGRLAVEKDLPLLLDAVAHVVRRHPEAGLALAGAGPMRPRLEQLAKRLGIADRIRFLGEVPHDQLAAVYASADAFVMPSRKDTHPLTVIEALASGLAVVVVDSPAYRGTITDGQTGLICDATAEKMSAAIGKLIVHGEVRARIGAAGLEISREFSVEKTTSRVLEVYSQVMAEFHRKGEA